MVWPQFSTEVLQLMTWKGYDRIGIESLEEPNSSLHNQMHVDIMNQKAKYLKKEREKNLKFPQKWHKGESIQLSVWRSGLDILGMNT